MIVLEMMVGMATGLGFAVILLGLVEFATSRG